MKNWLKISILAALVAGMVIVSGCTNTGSTTPVTQSTTPRTVVIVTTAIPAAAATATSQIQTPLPQITTVTTPAPVAYSTNDINKHFIDIAFGPDYS